MPDAADQGPLNSPSTELASQRTALAIERTRMAADRTLMAALRTSLALIGFGFTIFKFFQEIGKQFDTDVLNTPARNFGLSLVVLGVGLLVAALFNHWQTFVALGQRRDELHSKGLLKHEFKYRATPSGAVAVLLLLAGLLVILGIIARAGPFG